MNISCRGAARSAATATAAGMAFWHGMYSTTPHRRLSTVPDRHQYNSRSRTLLQGYNVCGFPYVPSRRGASRRSATDILPRASLRSVLGRSARALRARPSSARYARLTRTRRSATRLRGLRAHSHQLPSLMARNYPRLARVAAGILGSVPPCGIRFLTLENWTVNNGEVGCAESCSLPASRPHGAFRSTYTLSWKVLRRVQKTRRCFRAIRSSRACDCTYACPIQSLYQHCS